MKKFIIILAAVFSATIFTAPAHSVMKKVGQTGLQFLKVDMVPRAAAMGGAYTMVGNDASAMFYNPAGIGKMQHKFDFFSGRTQWIAGINYTAAGIAKDLGNWGAVGVSAIFCDYGDDMIGTQVASNEKGYLKTGSVDVGAYAFGLTYAKSLTDKFTIGGSVKYTGQNLGSSILTAGSAAVENKVNALAFDFGTIFYPGFESLRVGMSVNNFSGDVKYRKDSNQEAAFQLPLTFRIGAAMDVLDIFGEHESPLLIAVDALHPRDYTERVHVGGEYLFKNMIALRAGYKFNYDEEGLTAGIGIKYGIAGVNVKLDYSYGDLGVFETVSRFALGISL
jgi:hypothetical protein